MDTVKFEDLLGDPLVLREEQAVRTGAGEPLLNQLEIRGDTVIGGVVSGERFREVEDEIALHPRQRVQTLERSIENVERGFVTELAERLGNLFLHFLLVQISRQRCLVRSRAGLLRPLPPIVEDDNAKFAQNWADYNIRRWPPLAPLLRTSRSR